MVIMQPGERVVCTIKRHPFGILSSYISGALLIVVAAVIAFVLVPKLPSQIDTSHITPFTNAGFILLCAAVVFFLGIMTKVYWQNEWIVTSDSLTQITQNGLFARQSSQLSLENLEDVTVDQDGIVQHIFNFGTLRVETAGERSKFVFPLCPNPTQYAHEILQAREDFMNHRQYTHDS